MAATDSSKLVIARSIGTVGMGVATGIMASIPLWVMPSLYSVPICPKDRLHLWSKIYDNGKTTALTLFPTSTILFALAAYSVETPALYLPANFIARNRKIVLALCSSLSASVVGFTIAFLMPGIKRLKKEEADLTAGALPSFSTDEAIQEWGQKHLIRLAFAATSFGLAVAELASA
ncbi:hypothetical protein JCM5353_003130 [Sporobolomyces roseus]